MAAERVAMATRVLGRVPLIADADTGYGPPMSVARTVRAYEQAGAPVAPAATMEDFFRLVGLDEWFAVSERWSGGTV